MQELQFRTLVWLTYRLAATFAVGLPLVLIVWATLQRQTAMVRLLSIYWKVASLLGISMLLLTDQKPIGFLTLTLAPILMVASVWFWVDLNEELADLPSWKALPFTVRIWRWALSGLSVLALTLTPRTLPCIKISSLKSCQAWIEAPQGLHLVFQKIFAFLFGGQWTEPVAAFMGYLALLAYVVGILQWLLIRLPKQGRVAGEF